MRKIILFSMLLSLLLTACSNSTLKNITESTTAIETIIEETSVDVEETIVEFETLETSEIDENLLVKDIDYYNENKSILKFPTENIEITLEMDNIKVVSTTVGVTSYINIEVGINDLELWCLDNENYLLGNLNDNSVAYKFVETEQLDDLVDNTLDISNVTIKTVTNKDKNTELDCDFILDDKTYNGVFVVDSESNVLKEVRYEQNGYNVKVYFKKSDNIKEIPTEIEFIEVDEETIFDVNFLD